jgi:hypothetical protein
MRLTGKQLLRSRDRQNHTLAVPQPCFPIVISEIIGRHINLWSEEWQIETEARAADLALRRAVGNLCRGRFVDTTTMLYMVEFYLRTS